LLVYPWVNIKYKGIECKFTQDTPYAYK
jgi:hypothetical protein